MAEWDDDDNDGGGVKEDRYYDDDPQDNDDALESLGDLFADSPPPQSNQKRKNAPPPPPVFVFKAAPAAAPTKSSKIPLPPPRKEMPVCPICNQRLHHCTTEVLVSQHVDECLNMAAIRSETVAVPPPPAPPARGGGRAVLTDSDYARRLAAEQHAADEAARQFSPVLDSIVDDAGLLVRCPYVGCGQNVNAFSFPSHAVSRHTYAASQTYACPVCDLESGGYKPSAGTHLIQHIQKQHGDLITFNSAPAMPARSNIPPSQEQQGWVRSETNGFFGGAPKRTYPPLPPVPPSSDANVHSAVVNQAAAMAQAMGLGKNQNSPSPSPAPAAPVMNAFAKIKISGNDNNSVPGPPPPPPYVPPPPHHATPQAHKPAAQSSSPAKDPSKPQPRAPLFVEQTLAADLKVDCTICLEEFVKGVTIVRLECLCVFHKTCAEAWWLKSKTCPLHQPD